MILGVGIDLIEIQRIQRVLERSRERFLKRVFTSLENEKAPAGKKFFSHYAKRFAAKEALLKALGTGLSAGISWQDLEVRNSHAGQPYLHLKGKALELLHQRTPQGYKPHVHLSLSDTAHEASAIVVIDCRPEA